MAGVSSFEELLTIVRAAVDRELAATWARVLDEQSSRGVPVRAPLEAARDLCLRGGKRLRAALVAVGFRLGGGGDAVASVLEACCAVELLQAYFLIHDDWMDRDRLRRGGPAVHAALEGVFASEHLAASGAVLAGDFTLALATSVLGQTRVPDGRWPAVLKRFAQMQLDAVIGQKLDVLGDGSALDEVYRLKTASYTVQGPLLLGLELGPGSPLAGTVAAIEAFATPLGIAFQLRDDLIGAFADESITGKPRGGDLRAGKHTLLVSLALGRRGSDVERLVSRVLGDPEAAPERVDQALAALDACGARAEVERRITALAAEASAVLDTMPWPAGDRLLLDGLKRALLERVS
jgi:geranylgeranyl diphosphate synthase, type I